MSRAFALVVSRHHPDPTDEQLADAYRRTPVHRPRRRCSSRCRRNRLRSQTWCGAPEIRRAHRSSRYRAGRRAASARWRGPGSANDGCSRSRWVKAGHPTIPVARSCSMRSSAASASSRGRTNSVTGSCSAPVVASSPPIQKNGMAHRILADGSRTGDGPDRARPCRCLPDQGAVCVHDALRVRGGPGGVHHDGQIGG